MLTLHGWMIDERSYVVRLAASFLGISLTEITDRRAETYGPTLTDEDDLHCVGLFEILDHFTRLPSVTWSLPVGEGRAMLHWALEGLGQFSDARRHAFASALPRKAATDAVTFFYRTLDDRFAACALSGRAWLSGADMGFLDVLVFPVAALARDIGIPMDLYPAIRRFVHRVRQQPGFIVMPGIASCH